LFLHDINTLIDTPEDICHAINASGIEAIDRVLYSHADPDHALGFRVFEQLRLNWFDVSEGKRCTQPIDVMALPGVIADLNAIQSKFGPYMDYYAHTQNLIHQISIDGPLSFGDIELSVYPSETASVFVFKENKKKFIYAPCDVKPFPEDAELLDADLLLIGSTVVGEKLKNDYVLSADSFMKTALFSMEEIVALKERLKCKRVIITHLEEDWGKSYDDYLELSKEYEDIEFAYDGMIIHV
jgi:phosphoribosyl 1,2-cyclic phosphate phosphodiesterase